MAERQSRECGRAVGSWQLAVGGMEGYVGAQEHPNWGWISSVISTSSSTGLTYGNIEAL